MAEEINSYSDISILLIEENNDNRTEIIRMLEEATQKVYVARNCKEAIDIFLKYIPNIIIVNIKILITDEINLTGKIRQTAGHTQLISIVSAEDTEYIIKSIEIGIDCYVLKPVIKNKLFDCIKKCTGLIKLEKEMEKQSNFIQKLSCAVEQSPSTVIITDADGIIEYVNPKFTNLTGYLPEEAVGRNVNILKSGKTSEEIYKDLWYTVKKGIEWRGELINKKKNGEFYWEMVSISPVKNDDGDITHFVAVKEDITEKKKAEEALMISERNLRKRNNIIEQDLKNAQIIQNALLPKEIPVLKQLRIDYRYLPLETVGGDYFSFTKLIEGGMGIFLGDVTGHGVSAALFLALVKALTDRACRQFGQNPKKYFELLNYELMDNMTINFLTAIYGYFSFQDSSSSINFTLSIGGHPPPMVYRASSGFVEILDTHGTILGVIEKVVYREYMVPLYKGDRLFLYTDGLNETMNTGNDIFGFESLRKLIKKSNTEFLGATLDKILNGISQYRGDAPVLDDIVLIGIEVK